MTDITWTNDTRRLQDLVPWEHNPKRMTKKQAEGLRLSIERFGFAVPFLVSPDGDIYDGHQRQALMGAIKQYGPNATVDVRVSSRQLTDDERRELVVRLKQNQAGWDFDMLPNLYEKEELLEWGFEPEELGMFPADDMADDPGAQIDRAEELQAKWGVKSGDLWQLGEHRLICGDCTDSQVVARVMDGEQADLLLSDPPYGMQWDTDSTRFTGGVKPDLRRGKGRQDWGEIHGDNEDFDPSPWLSYPKVILWGYHHFAQRVAVGTILVWIKRSDDLFGSFLSDAELAWMKGGYGVYCFRKQFPPPSRMAENNGQVAHPTQKPIDLIEWCILRSGEVNIVFDPFSGSGTTLIACERLGRRCRAVEIEPGYVAVALQRWHDMTGVEPVLLSSSGGIVDNAT